MKALVTYYSRTGTMDKIAEMVKANLASNGVTVDVQRIHRVQDISFIGAGFETIRNIRPEIQETPADLSSYDIVFVGYPTWAQRPATPIMTFVEKGMLNASGKKFFVLAVAGSTQHASKTIPEISEALSALGGEVVGSMDFCQRMRAESETKAQAIAQQVTGSQTRIA